MVQKTDRVNRMNNLKKDPNPANPVPITEYGKAPDITIGSRILKN